MKKLIFAFAVLMTGIASAQIDVTPTEGLIIEPKPLATLNGLNNKPSGLIVNSGETLLWWNGTTYIDILAGGGGGGGSTDDQQLSLSGNTVTLEDGGSVNIATTTAVAANTAKVSNVTHSGDVTGATSLTISNGAVSVNKIATNAVITSKILDGSVTASKLENSGVTPGSFTTANITVDAKGRITSASNGSGGETGAVDETADYIWSGKHAFGKPSMEYLDTDVEIDTAGIDHLKVLNKLELPVDDSDPVGASSGNIFYNTAEQVLKYGTASGWETVGTDNQTLEDALALGNSAGSYHINLNGRWLQNVNRLYANHTHGGVDYEMLIAPGGVYLDSGNRGFLLEPRIDGVIQTGELGFDFVDKVWKIDGDEVLTTASSGGGITTEQAERINNQGFLHTQTYSISQTITAAMARPDTAPNRSRRGKIIFDENATATLSNVLPIDYYFELIADETIDSLIIVPTEGGILYGEMNTMQFRSENVDAISVKPGYGVIVARTATDEYNVIGRADAVSLVPPINNIYTEDNVISEDVETDSYGTITEVGGGTPSKPATGGQDGGRYFHLEGATDNTSDRVEIPWSGAVVGDIIEVSYYIRIDANLGQRTAAPVGLTDVGGGAFTQDFYTTETTWTKVTYFVEASEISGVWRVYTGGDGDVDIDSFIMDNQGQ